MAVPAPAETSQRPLEEPGFHSALGPVTTAHPSVDPNGWQIEILVLSGDVRGTR